MSLPSTGFLQVKLDKEITDYLWRIIEKSNKTKKDYKQKLAGNINKSYSLYDENNFFYKSVCKLLIEKFRKANNGIDPTHFNTLISSNTPLLLKEFWVNYQYQTEFNPYHWHGGVYSFAIWMKIPYDCNELAKLPQFVGTKRDDIKAGLFEFEFIDSIGNIKNLKYPLSSKLEGYMVFFPAVLRHCVYPFYGSNEPRISIAGNLWFDTTTLDTKNT